MQDVLYVAAGRVAQITLNRPDDENRITPAVLERLGAIADALAADAETSSSPPACCTRRCA
jgi:enoyl-CoA hydratase/carnithine racemase